MFNDRIQFLRDVVVTRKGKAASTVEFSYDSGDGRAPHFSDVPADDLIQARALYLAWGGNRPEGYPVGTTVRSPWPPLRLQFKSIWKQSALRRVISRSSVQRPN